MKHLSVSAKQAIALLLLTAAPRIMAQAVSTPAPAQTGGNDQEEIVSLDPFTVSSDDSDGGYQVKDTLAGSRVRTELRDVAAAVSVVNAGFLRDTGAKNNQDLLVYTTNTEVGGVYGNFSGAGDAPTFNETANLIRPSSNTRVRGLDSADNTRDYFLTDIPWDNYNVDRVDLSRGANSILFGVGSPAGIINASLNGASFKTGGKLEARLGSYGSARASLDYNHVLLRNTLSIRVSILDDMTKFRQKPAYNDDRRAYGAVRYEPKIFGTENKTSIRANYEHGKVTANRPRTLPPNDGVTPFWTRLKGATYNLYTDTTTGPNFSEKFFGRQYNADIAMIQNYDGKSYQNLMANFSNTYGIGPDGKQDSGVSYFSGTPRALAINGMSTYARAAGIPGGKFWKNYSLADSSIFDFYTKLLDGPNKRETQDWDASNIALSQTFFNNRLAFELVYDYQRYKDKNLSILTGGEYYIGIDINKVFIDNVSNPNVGRAYTGSSGQYGNNINMIDRDSIRFTTTGEIRGEDFLRKGWLADAIGRQVFTGLLSSDQQLSHSKGFVRWASTPDYSDITGGSKSISDGTRQVEWITYLSDQSFLGKASAAGGNLHAIEQYISPGTSQSVKYFDAHWNAFTVDPAAAYTYTSLNSGATMTSTQSENPANYVGWTTKDFAIYNSEKGGIDDLFTSSGKVKRQIKSQALTWQGYFLKGTVVPTIGLRHDDVYSYTGNSDVSKNKYQVANDNYDVVRTGVTRGDSKSYSIVVHTPESLKAKSPWRTSLSLFANKSENFKADSPRADITGKIIPNPKGNTKDYGFVINTLDDKLSLKVTKYESKVTNATLQGDGAGFSDSLYYAWAAPTWLIGQAYNNYRGLTGDPTMPAGNDWFWNYAAADQAYAAGQSLSAYLDGHPEWKGYQSANVQGAAITKTQMEGIKAVFANIPSQAFFDAYGIPLVSSKLSSTNPADWHAGFALTNTPDIDGNNNGYINWTQPSFGGKIATTGDTPKASVDTISEGYEIELTAQPTKEWNLTANVAKTTASRSNLSGTIRSYIESFTKLMAGPAGDIRIWGAEPWGSDFHTFRKTWDQNILSPYKVFLASEGSSAAEVAPWRCNLITNYTFSRGVLKGINVGGAYRYEAAKVIGYQYNPSTDLLDITKKIKGESDDAVDVWVGYTRKLSSKYTFRTQVNLRNVGDKVRLTPVSAQPDGTTALSRIVEGFNWQWTNTLSF